MELYAAMIEYMDDQIGRLIDHLKKSGKYDNTLIVFLSDNAAAGEDMAELINKLAPTAKDWFAKTFDNRIENWGRPGSCVEYGPPWAQVSSVPFRLFKGVVAEGGVRTAHRERPRRQALGGNQSLCPARHEHHADVLLRISRRSNIRRRNKGARCRAAAGEVDVTAARRTRDGHSHRIRTGWAGSCSATGRSGKVTGSFCTC